MKTTKRTDMKRIALIIGLLIVLVFIVLLAYRLISGKPLGLRFLAEKTIAWATNPVKMVVNGKKIAQQSTGDFTNIVFLHHSTGKNLIQQGHLVDLLAQDGYALWDHGYNYPGLIDPQRQDLGYNYSIPGDNTDPNGLIEIFRQPELPLPLNTFTALMQHEVIVTKSCFKPGNNIRSDAQLQQYKDWYLEIRQTMAANPDRFFVIMTIPPLNPAETNAEEAARARDFANWLKSDAFTAGHSNIAVFDFFDLLAEDDPSAPDYNMLRAEYRDGEDSHPNQTANEAAAPVFAEFLNQGIAEFRAVAQSSVQ